MYGILYSRSDRNYIKLRPSRGSPPLAGLAPPRVTPRRANPGEILRLSDSLATTMPSLEDASSSDPASGVASPREKGAPGARGLTRWSKARAPSRRGRRAA